MSRVLKNLFGSGWTFVYSLAASGIITYLGSAWITRNLLETESQGRWAMPLAMIFLLLALVTAPYRHDARALVLSTYHLHDKRVGVLLLAEVGLLATAILGNTRPRENYPHSRALAR